MSIHTTGVDSGPAPSWPASLTVVALRGSAWIDDPLHDAGRRTYLEIRDEVPAGTAVTTAANGRLALRFASSYSVRLDTETRVRLPAAGTLALDQGALYVDSGPSRGADAAAPLTIQTPLGSIRDPGGQSEIRVRAGSLRIRVREGLVVFHGGSRAHHVPAGGQLTLQEGARVAIDGIPTHGPDWAWTADVAAVPEFSGRSAREFLEWVARERGWRLRFASPDVAASAKRIVLGGAVDRLTLEEALDAVLPACGMSYRVEQGSLIIGPPVRHGPAP